MRWTPPLKQAARQESKEENHEPENAGTRGCVLQRQGADRGHPDADCQSSSQPATRRAQKAPEQIIAPDIRKLKQAHMKLREMADILGIETQALEI
jgi:hypothetical protein